MTINLAELPKITIAATTAWRPRARTVRGQDALGRRKRGATRPASSVFLQTIVVKGK